MKSMVISRCDRLGDLILSLPALGLVRDAGVVHRTLHCSSYARDVALWAQHNGLCEDIWIAGDAPPKSVTPETPALALFHNAQTASDYRKAKFVHSFSPRSKLATLWSYRHTVVQHRSRVEKSEMHYNLDLVRVCLRHFGLKVPEFHGLPALDVPRDWSAPRKSPHTVICVSNAASASNWGLREYLKYAESIFEESERSVDFLVSGHDASMRKQGILDSGLLRRGFGMVEAFGSVRELIAYLSKAQFVVASSTGPLHIAHASGVNVFGVYPVDRVQSFDRWRPDGYWHQGFVRYQILP